MSAQTVATLLPGDWPLRRQPVLRARSGPLQRGLCVFPTADELLKRPNSRAAEGPDDRTAETTGLTSGSAVSTLLALRFFRSFGRSVVRSFRTSAGPRLSYMRSRLAG